MKTLLYRLLTGALFVLGSSAWVVGLPLSLVPYGPALLGLAVIFLIDDLLSATYYRSGTPWPEGSRAPQSIRVGLLDYVKAAVSWLNAFKRTYVVEPGLYYTGATYDHEAPLLVTANYRLSVFLLLRRIRGIDVRLLVVDTDGINVWCAAGKGAFGNASILAQIERYDRSVLTTKKWLRVVVPKFGMAGIDIRAFHDAHVRTIIGPLYAKDLPAYLREPRLRDCNDAIVDFGLQMRTFSWLPGLKQMFGYSVLVVLAFLALHALVGWSIPVGLIAISMLIATMYPLLYPWLPGARFAVKGLWLGASVAAAMAGAATVGILEPAPLAASIPFSVAMGIFFGLAYTGNSAVSNYSGVRKETARFLVPNAALFAVSLVAFIVMEVAP